MDIKKYIINKLIYKSKSHYQTDLKKKVKAKCIKSYNDIELKRKIKKDEILELYLDRYEHLKNLGLVERR